LPVFYASVAFFFSNDWFKKQKLAQELEKKNLQSELSMLKNQINPHFLFNTLNNIDSLIKKNPDYASQSIVELSDMMRYMIYETNVKKVPLAKELKYIDDYLALQKLQYFNDDLVEYTVVGNPDNIEIAPMLFIPFIENAFKHCTDKETKHAIRFSFAIDADKIRFDAVKKKKKNHAISKDETSGIGLETVKRRLEILYPNRYSLGIDEKNDLFCVSLEIQM
jgi:LytS/YehU family sensor histidine kinase